jgi:hypothetical protein
MTLPHLRDGLRRVEVVVDVVHDPFQD